MKGLNIFCFFLAGYYFKGSSNDLADRLIQLTSKFTDLYKPKVNENEEGFDSVKGSSEGTGREQIEENVELLPT